MKPVIPIAIALFALAACNSTTKKNTGDSTPIQNEISPSNASATGEDFSDSIAPKDWVRVAINTTLGPMVVALNPLQKQHTNNFISLVNKGFYNGILFHRVIKDFMIQTGDPKSKNAAANASLGDGGPGYTVPSEIKSNLKHFRGAISAARQSDDMNPMKNSSGSQFFIVTGTQVAENQYKQALEQLAFEMFRKDPENAETVRKAQMMSQSGNMAALREIELQVQEKMKPLINKLYSDVPKTDIQRYAQWGGAPNLDNNYTVYGKLVSGYNVLSAIENQPTNQQDRPTQDIVIIEAKVLK